MLVGHLRETKKEYKILKKQEIQDKLKPAFNTIWLMEIFKICLEEQLLITCYVAKHLILIKIQKNDGYQGGNASMVYVLIKCFMVVLLKDQLFMNQLFRLSSYKNLF